ncbi:hypothetical protein TSAR_016357 [Trichomalopsis sarcophagae]|uniref:Uncharacterized protein n=1 Tax=Trichomalopsis sarcophagae TaxID=543379 RepID=A0A232FC71_9HYME|nr:hypothetical protein TSAR_016357 [Trichomalopsis sarcophagae]
MYGGTMVEPRERSAAQPQHHHHHHQQQHHHHHYRHQVIKTTRVHQSSRSTRVVTVQEKVIRSRLQLGYSTPTNFINRGLVGEDSLLCLPNSAIVLKSVGDKTNSGNPHCEISKR